MLRTMFVNFHTHNNIKFIFSFESQYKFIISSVYNIYSKYLNEIVGKKKMWRKQSSLDNINW